jgi:uncharacterized protein YukE
MVTLNVPPETEFNGLAGLLETQSEHFDDLRTYANGVIDNTGGMEEPGSVLSLICDGVRLLHAAAIMKVNVCYFGMSESEDKVRQARREYASTDEDSATDLAATIFTQYEGRPETRWQVPQRFPEITDDVPNLPLHTYHDQATPTLTEPAAADAGLGVNVDEVKGKVGQVEQMWKTITGESLLERLIKPITGNLGRLNYLSQGYQTVSYATYDIAGNLRSGTLVMAPKWDGPAGKAFEFYMFKWHMGIGGLGDVFQIVSTGFADLFHAAWGAIKEILDLINRLIDQFLKRLFDKYGGRNPLDPRVCTPENPDGTVDATELRETLLIISRAMKLIRQIEAKINELREAFENFKAKLAGWRDQLTQATDTARQIAADPVGWTMKTLDEKTAYHRKVVIERNQGPGWNPELGAWRVGLLPR